MIADTEPSPLLLKLLVGIIAPVAILSIVLILTALATDAAAMFGKAVDFNDNPLDLYHILRTNLFGVIGFYYLLQIYEEAQKL